MKRSARPAIAALLLALAATSPAAAQGESITATPADGLVDGDVVEISATTTGSDYGTLALCPAAAAPVVGDPVTDLIRTRDICVGLVCLHDGDTEPALIDAVAADCPLAVQPSPISSVSTTAVLPRVTNDGTDCAATDCVIVFNTWNSGSAQGAVSVGVTFQETDPVPTTSTTTSVAPADTTTTIELSAPTVTSTAAPVPTTSAAAPVPTTTTVAAQVLGAQETNDAGELALTGLDAGPLVALGLALMAAGGGVVTRSRRG